MTEENNDIPVEETPEPTPEAPVAPQKPAEFDFDARLYTQDGKFNQEGAKEYLSERDASDAKYEERLLGLRRVVSRNGEAVKEPTEYFQDYAPPEKFSKFFSDDTPEETRNYMTGMTDKLANKYLDMGLNKQQAFEVSNTILEVMEETGVLDTRNDEQKYIDDQKYIEEQRAKLGSNAEGIIREAETFILNSNEFDATQKNKMLDMIKGGDMSLVSIMHAIKDSFGSRTGGIPTNITNLGGLKPDTELREEYATASPERRNEIINQRHKAGRKGKLFG